VAEAPTYFYETAIEWKGEKSGILSGAGLPTVAAGAPPEYNGREGDWSPEHLFVASLNTCYMLTFLAIAEFSKVSIVSFSSTAKGKLEKVPSSTYQVTEIVVKPRVVIASANDLARMPRILEKTKENCFVSNSIKSAIKVEPEVYQHQTQAFPWPVGEAPPISTEPSERKSK